MNKFFCLSSNLSYFFKKMNIEIEPSAVFGLARCIGTTYCLDDRFSFEKINGRSGTYKEMLSRFSSACCIEFIPFTPLIQDEEAVGRLISEGSLLIEVDDFFLEYSAFYLKHHYKRLVVLNQIQNDRIELFDETERQLDTGLFRKAAGREALCYWVDCSRFRLTEEAVMTSIEEICLACLADYCSDGIVTGYPALDQFFNDIYSYARGLPKDEFHKFMDMMFFQMNRPGGLSNSRYMLSEYLRWAGEYCRRESLSPFARSFLELATVWETGGNLFFRGKFIYDPEIIKSIQEFIAGIAERERKEFEKLLNWAVTRGGSGNGRSNQA